MSRRFFPTLCVLLLLVAQQGALFHATWHVSGATQVDHPVHGHDGHVVDSHVGPESLPGKGGESGQGSLCVFDLAFGQVLGGTHGVCAPLVFVRTVVERIHDVTVPRLHVAALSPKSRGPPVLL